MSKSVCDTCGSYTLDHDVRFHALDERLAKVEARLDADPWRNNQTAPPLASAEGRPLCAMAGCYDSPIPGYKECSWHATGEHDQPREAAKDSPALLTRDDVDQMRTPPQPEPPVRQASAETIEAVASMTRKWPVPPEPQPEAPAGFKIVGTSGPGVEQRDDQETMWRGPAGAFDRELFAVVKGRRDSRNGDGPWERGEFYILEPLPAAPPSDAGQVHVNNTLTDACNARWNMPAAPNAPVKQESPRRAAQLSTSACGRIIASGVKCGDRDRRCTDCLPELATAPASAEGRPLCPHGSGVAPDCCGLCYDEREAAKDSPAPPGYRLADGWHPVLPVSSRLCDMGTCPGRVVYGNDEGHMDACPDHAIDMGALVPVTPAPLLTRDVVDQMRTPPQPEAPAGFMAHRLKTWPEFLDAVVSGRKNFEIRKNDRDFKVGDEVILEEFDEVHGYTGRRCSPLTITYVTPPSRCLPDGVVGFGFEKSRRVEKPLPAAPPSDAGQVSTPRYFRRFALHGLDDVPEGAKVHSGFGPDYAVGTVQVPAPSEPAKRPPPISEEERAKRAPWPHPAVMTNAGDPAKAPFVCRNCDELHERDEHCTGWRDGVDPITSDSLSQRMSRGGISGSYQAEVADLETRLAEAEKARDDARLQRGALTTELAKVEELLTAAQEERDSAIAGREAAVGEVAKYGVKLADALANAERWKSSNFDWKERAQKAHIREDASVLAERARVNGWWMAWFDWYCNGCEAPFHVDMEERDAGIASGAPAPGVVK